MTLSETTGSIGFTSHMHPEGLLYKNLKKTEGFGGAFKSESMKSSFPDRKCLFYRYSTVSSIPVQERGLLQKTHGCLKIQPLTPTAPARMQVSESTLSDVGNACTAPPQSSACSSLELSASSLGTWWKVAPYLEWWDGSNQLALIEVFSITLQYRFIHNVISAEQAWAMILGRIFN